MFWGIACIQVRLFLNTVPRMIQYRTFQHEEHTEQEKTYSETRKVLSDLVTFLVILMNTTISITLLKKNWQRNVYGWFTLTLGMVMTLFVVPHEAY